MITFCLVYFSQIPLAFCNGEKSLPLLPEELLILAKSEGLDQVNDFYVNRPGMLNPPYIYGYLQGPKENSAVFWAQKKENNKKKYFLLIMEKRRNNNKNVCSEKIEWNSYPRGLSIYKNRNTTLDDFFYLRDRNKRLPKNIRMENNAILSEYDGVEVLFYCYNGEWVVRIRH